METFPSGAASPSVAHVIIEGLICGQLPLLKRVGGKGIVAKTLSRRAAVGGEAFLQPALVVKL